jgi:uncharacterized repeat protein (TIGR03803 family)
VLYRFCSTFDGTNCADGSGPFDLAVSLSGVLYGVTAGGGLPADQNGGTAYELLHTGGSWRHTILHYFCGRKNCVDGIDPQSVALTPSGSLAGTTAGGGTNGKNHAGGVIYRLTPKSGGATYATKYSFCSQTTCADGEAPTTLVAAKEYQYFGSAMNGGGHKDDPDKQGGGGVVFNFDSNKLKVLHAFCSLSNCRDGAYPVRLIAAADGTLFGITQAGGTAGEGTVFRIAP